MHCVPRISRGFRSVWLQRILRKTAINHSSSFSRLVFDVFLNPGLACGCANLRSRKNPERQAGQPSEPSENTLGERRVEKIRSRAKRLGLNFQKPRGTLEEQSAPGPGSNHLAPGLSRAQEFHPLMGSTQGLLARAPLRGSARDPANCTRVMRRARP